LAATACATRAGLAPPQPVREVVVDGLKSPWSIAFISATEALITEKEGGLLRADLKTGATTPISGLPSDLVDDIRSVSVADNGGLFEVVLHPGFDENRFIYLSYAARNETGRTTKVVRGVLDGDALTELRAILVAEPYTDDEFFHYGGGMAFGPDGRLYITVGERLYREADEPPLPIAQDVGDRRGKIYRLTADGAPPPDNPEFEGEAIPGMYALGVRAAQGITAHPETGEIWFSEHGGRQGDEINRLAAGANYGWPVVTTGGYRDEDYVPPDLPDRAYADPVWSWRQTVAPTGLAFYFGEAFPSWRGDLFVSGLSIGGLWRLNVENGAIVSAEELFVNDRIRSRKVAVGPSGDLYMLTDTLFEHDGAGGLAFSGGPGGQLLRIVNAAE
ncbi:MAG: PQQ-dependent sugar dehydrogenase, partial [Caulobacterales bacterium]|nr:PQQ-dependent sugar dehydrogenase [Caulobacterales bacterium]